MKTKIANRKSIYSGLHDLFSADLSSLIVVNFNWLCLQKNKISAFENLLFVDYIKTDSSYPFPDIEFTFLGLVG
jgi:hypothetical protein